MTIHTPNLREIKDLRQEMDRNKMKGLFYLFAALTNDTDTLWQEGGSITYLNQHPFTLDKRGEFAYVGTGSTPDVWPFLRYVLKPSNHVIVLPQVVDVDGSNPLIDVGSHYSTPRPPLTPQGGFTFWRFPPEIIDPPERQTEEPPDDGHRQIWLEAWGPMKNVLCGGLTNYSGTGGAGYKDVWSVLFALAGFGIYYETKEVSTIEGMRAERIVTETAQNATATEREFPTVAGRPFIDLTLPE